MNKRTNTGNAAGWCMRHARRALTLTELLVVVLIIAALLAVAVPSFSSLLYSSEAASAESQLVGAMRAARDTALRSSSRDDVMLVFSYEPAPGGGRTVITPCIKAGEFWDLPTTIPIAQLREIFVPSPVVEPVQLPRNWNVRGYAPANAVDPAGLWYEGDRYGQTNQRGDWVFPETGFYTPGTASEGQFRQTFAIRFAGGTGAMSTQTTNAVLVLMPGLRDHPNFQNVGQAEVSQLRPLRLGNPRRYVERVISSTTINPGYKRELLGLQSPDMVTVKPVTAVALYDEARLANGLRARLDPATGCLYRAHQTGQAPTFVQVTNAGGATTDNDAETTVLVNRWIEGDTNLDGRIERREDGDEPDARVFTVDRYSGTLKRVETQQ